MSGNDSGEKSKKPKFEAIYTIHCSANVETRQGKAFQGLLKRYFNK